MEQLTSRAIEIFKELSRIPRISKKEEHITQWLTEFAERNKWKVSVDDARNVVIRVPGNACPSETSTLVLQGHTDMVCEKHPDSNHDFSKDPIGVREQDEWLTADGTTLGADNGIAVALALAISEQNGITRPPLELLFTADEETGMTGAKALTPASFQGRTLINLDSEDEGVFTVGCAGGLGCEMKWEGDLEDVVPVERATEIVVSGLKGGHSGVDIHEQRANANILLCRILCHMNGESSLKLHSMKGGSASNAIPRDATATVFGGVQESLGEFTQIFRDEFPQEPDIGISFTEATVDGGALSRVDTGKVLSFLMALPNGVQRMSTDIAGLVETSCNFATVSLEKGKLETKVSCRSSASTVLEALWETIAGVSSLMEAKLEIKNQYPAWKPVMDSSLLKMTKASYTRQFGKAPVVEVIHAGLECGVIGESIPDMDMISLGPTIQGAHSPEERLNVPSLDRVSMLLLDVLKSACRLSGAHDMYQQGEPVQKNKESYTEVLDEVMPCRFPILGCGSIS